MTERKQFDSYDGISVGDKVFTENGLSKGEKGVVLSIEEGSTIDICVNVDYKGNGHGISKKPENIEKISCECSNEKFYSKERGWYCLWCEE